MSLLLPGVRFVFSTIRDLVWYIGHQHNPEKAIPTKPRKDSKGGIQNPIIDQTTQVSSKVLTAAPAFFAVIIGINEYKHNRIPELPNLNGCVSDADEIAEFLQHTLGVPSHQITNLRNSQATRDNIINAIRRLADDPRIKQGDPILIYYAGHGAEAKNGNSKTSIQMLLPYDFMPETSKDERAQGIYDFTFGKLLSHIAHAKGNNISVILDSCHSGSGTRKAFPSHDSLDAVRGVDLPAGYKAIPTVDDHLELEVGSDRKAVISPGHAMLGLSSHVLLAATSSSGVAAERRGRGAFTRALLDLFNQFSPDTLTYMDVIIRLPDIPSQFPQCEGLNASRILFNGRAPKTDRQLYRVICKQPPKRGEPPLLLEAGEAQGIAPGAKFNLYKSRNVDAPVYATVHVKGPPRACTSVLEYSAPPTDPTPSPTLWALQTYIGDNVQHISVALPLDPKFVPLIRKVVRDMNEQRPTKRNITLVDLNEPHTLSLRYDPSFDSVFFDINDTQVVSLGVRSIVSSVEIDDGLEDRMLLVLSSAADFFYHLNRSHMKDEPNRLSKKVTLEAHVLDDSGEPAPGPGLNIRDGTLQVAEDDAVYGFNIINKSDTPLYAWIFLFEMSDLSISLLYGSNFAKAADGEEQLALDASIPAHGELTIGYGAGGADPLMFSVSPENTTNVELSYLKIFLSTKPIDLSFVQQQSPFDQHRAGRKVQRIPDQWDALKLAILVRR
ncbi:hypothetical protein CYLTODRAFT_418152 [Cylindrobasidium torrendii FP15055 ss-10]|uniref:Peptidase C14 caspase domain-containing protein n=1 Tax=Cylindrobasidium torrendii FP15055 ss-10 TaxID=1314674 RepID=A0A0D7BPQ7_9AGAR|nr:hypothetical protein CYLTODRAFT_418152 [Cylindrobasidium torrendii FP15055 ss-10]